MADNVLTKKIGPFTGGVWLLVIGGGVGLALVLRKSFAGGTPAPMPIVVETVPLKGQATPPLAPPISGPVGGSVGGPVGKPPGGPVVTSKPPTKPPTTPPTMPPAPTGPPVTVPLPPKPPLALKPVITLFTVLPATITQGQVFTLAWSTSGAQKVVLKRPAGEQEVPAIGSTTARPGAAGTFSYTLTATNSGGSTTKTVSVTVRPTSGGAGTKNIPGGFSGACPVTGAVPPDYMQRKAQSIAVYQDRRTKTGWAIFNLGYAGDIFGINIWLGNPLNYAVLNRVRDGRGLRALSYDEIMSLKADVSAIATSLNGKENRLTNAQIMTLWERWNTPFLCANSPRRIG